MVGYFSRFLQESCPMTEPNNAGPSRRDFIRDATAAAVGTAAVARFQRARRRTRRRQRRDSRRAGGLRRPGHGCGRQRDGRGARRADRRAGRRVPDRLDRVSRAAGRAVPRHGQCGGQDHCFVGLDAYQQLLKTDINYVILASPPGFRATHIAAADGCRQEHLRGKARCGGRHRGALLYLRWPTRSPSAASPWAPGRSTVTSIRTSSR